MDLNCGCPQKWAIHEHIGAYLMDYPELVRDMVKQVSKNGRKNTIINKLWVMVCNRCFFAYIKYYLFNFFFVSFYFYIYIYKR